MDEKIMKKMSLHPRERALAPSGANSFFNDFFIQGSAGVQF
jgi:hypothetical protein